MTTENFNRAKSGTPASEPLGLVSVFAAETDLGHCALGAALAQEAARPGQSVLLVDCAGGESARLFGVTPAVTLKDVLHDSAALTDAKYISPRGDIAICAGGNAALEDLLGPVTAMSLSYDAVIVTVPAGCTPAHVQLAAGSDAVSLSFHAAGDRFMRAYWTLDAIRAAAPRCDPYMVGIGSKPDVFETYDLFAATVRDFLGGPPPLGGAVDDASDARNLHITASARYICEAIGKTIPAARRA